MRRIRKDDQVKVIAGKDAGRTGRVVRIFPHRDKALVEGVNYVKKHERIQSQRGAQQGGIIETEAPVHLSNLMPVCPSCGDATRVGYEFREGSRYTVFATEHRGRLSTHICSGTTQGDIDARRFGLADSSQNTVRMSPQREGMARHDKVSN
jgi:large subunit ribosomal protein L24